MNIYVCYVGDLTHKLIGVCNQPTNRGVNMMESRGVKRQDWECHREIIRIYWDVCIYIYMCMYLYIYVYIYICMYV